MTFTWKMKNILEQKRVSLRKWLMLVLGGVVVGLLFFLLNENHCPVWKWQLMIWKTVLTSRRGLGFLFIFCVVPQLRSMPWRDSNHGLLISLLKKELTPITIRKTIALVEENSNSVAVWLIVVMFVMNWHLGEFKMALFFAYT